MSAFSYIALDPQQKRKKGVVEADNPRQARQQLRDRNLMPLEVRIAAESKQSKRWIRFSLRRKWSTVDLVLVTRQMATLLNSDIPIDELLKAVSEQAEKPQVKQILLGLRAKVLEGYTLADSMKAFPATFSKLYRTTIAAGEQSGQLGVVLNKLAEFIEGQYAMSQKIRQALVYPTVMTLVSVAIVVFLLINVVPKIVNVFTSTHQTLPLSTQVLIGVSHGIRQYGLVILLVLLVIIYVVIRMLKNPKTRRKYHRLLLNLPVLGKAIRTINCARFGRTLGILTASSVPVLESMQAASQLVVPLPMQDAMKIAIERVREGSRIYQALKHTGYFPPLFLHLIASGESSGQLESMLEKSANYLERDIEHLIQSILTLFEPVMILVMGSIVLFIVLAIMLPIFSLDQLGAEL